MQERQGAQQASHNRKLQEQILELTRQLASESSL